MILEVLPERTGGAAENMATDFLLLQRYPQGRRRAVPALRLALAVLHLRLQPEDILREEPASAWARPLTSAAARPAAGSWTTATTGPTASSSRGAIRFEEARATQSYRAIHEALAAALAAAGVPVALKPVAEPVADGEPGGPAGVCFERAEIFDVVHAGTGAKIAGGAQKRNKRGLLFQGSIWRPAAGGASVDWEKFGEDFVGRLACALGAAGDATPVARIQRGGIRGTRRAVLLARVDGVSLSRPFRQNGQEWKILAERPATPTRR